MKRYLSTARQKTFGYKKPTVPYGSCRQLVCSLLMTRLEFS